MQKFYFTFGSSMRYPYQNTYLVVEAMNRSSAIDRFRKDYPDRSENTVNCAFIYSQAEWDETRMEESYGKPVCYLHATPASIEDFTRGDIMDFFREYLEQDAEGSSYGYVAEVLEGIMGVDTMRALGLDTYAELLPDKEPEAREF